MKKITICLIFLIMAAAISAQPPQAFKYQVVVRDSDGNVLVNDTIAFKLSIIQGSISGTAVYIETQTDTTNQFGLISLQIGNGTVVSGNFSSIDWGADDYFLKVEMDIDGGTAYEEMGTSQLFSVPYALYSGTSGDDGDWIIAGDDMYSSVSGNVGIGTTDPSTRFQVAGGYVENLDQQNTIFEAYAGGSFWQSFTAGITGDLARIDIQMINPSTSTLTIYSGEGLGGSVLHTQTISWSAGWSQITLSMPVAVIEGSKYTMHINSATQWHISILNPYPGGICNGVANNDVCFKTYVMAQGVGLSATSDGNVGIGTSSPEEHLHVAGKVKIEDMDNSSSIDSLVTWDPADSILKVVSFSSLNDNDWDISGNYVYTLDSVGIGTTSPDAPLHIETIGSDLLGSGSLLLSDPSNANRRFVHRISDDPFNYNIDRNYLGTWYNTLTIARSTGYMGIGNISPESHLHLTGHMLFDNNYQIKFKDSDGTSRTCLHWGSNDFVKLNANNAAATAKMVFYTSTLERMRIDENGNVGIGAIGPQSKLQVGGEIRVIYNATGENKVYVGQGQNTGGGINYDGAAGTDKIFLFTRYLEEDTNRLAINLFNGNIGIGELNPDERLHIDGSIKMVDGNEGTGKIMVSDGVGVGSWTDASVLNDNDWKASGDSLFRIFGSDTLVTITEKGYVGIGTTNPSGILHIDGGTADAGINATDIIIEAQTGGEGNTYGGKIILLPKDGTNLNYNSKVGIGTLNPSFELHLQGLGQRRFGVESLTTGTASLELKNTDQWTSLQNYDGNVLRVFDYTDGLTRFVIDTYGQVGIGTGYPDAPLHIVTTGSDIVGAGGLLLADPNNSNRRFIHRISNDPFNYHIDRKYIGTWYNALTITRSTGYVGIGTTSPESHLHLIGHMLLNNNYQIKFKDSDGTTRTCLHWSTDDLVKLSANNAAATAQMSFYISGQERMRINENGNVGIGTPTPLGRLQVTGDEARIGDNGTIDYATEDGDLYVEDQLEVDGHVYQAGTQRRHNGMYEYVYSTEGTLNGSGDITISVPDRLYVAGDNIPFTYEVWVSIGYDEPYGHADRGVAYLRGLAWKERGDDVTGYLTESTYYQGSAVSITPGTYTSHFTQFVINTSASDEKYRFTVRCTSGGH